MKPPTGWSLVAYMKRTVSARLALIVLCVALVAIVAGTLYVVRHGDPAPYTVPRGASQSAYPSIPTGYATGDPIPTNTGFQAGDAG